ncbi:MAG: hypothetical protein BZ136_01785 [Methanosphaera sp. rholeuAM74]|nr:MAG: hypothetical protein BZ136_01785 [Methanosphaera sp. rholeuAM74]
MNYESIEGSISGTAADIFSKGNIIINNNTFTNSYATGVASSIYAYVYTTPSDLKNITITNNKFQSTKSVLDTIVIEKMKRIHQNQ